MDLQELARLTATRLDGKPPAQISGIILAALQEATEHATASDAAWRVTLHAAADKLTSMELQVNEWRSSFKRVIELCDYGSREQIKIVAECALAPDIEKQKSAIEEVCPDCWGEGSNAVGPHRKTCETCGGTGAEKKDCDHCVMVDGKHQEKCCREKKEGV